MLVHLQQASPLAAFIIVGREITISALREWMAQLGKSQSVAVSLLGKIKTTCQMLAILILLIGEAGLPHTPILIIGQTVLWTAALLTLWSMIYYCKIAYPFLKNPHKSS
jgi:CDP-diacylglycerol--glycerol-3-phosphate 3-phosphatidyltransferase